jgi:NTE family protein
MFGSSGRFWRSDTGGLTAPVRRRPERTSRQPPKIGLALGGGAARGWAHIGVLHALAELGIKVDIIAGTSIGAVVGGCYAADALASVEAFARDLTRRRVFGLLDLNFAGSGLIAGNRMAKLLDGRLRDCRIEDLSPRFVCIATELGTGHEVWMSRGRLVDAMRASYALPGIFQPVHVSGRWLVDGALVNPVPVSAARALGAEIVIAVSLNADAFGRGTVVQDHSAEPVARQAIAELAAENGLAPDARRMLRRQLVGGGRGPPGISTVMVEAFNIIQDRISRSRLAGDPPDILLAPKLGRIGHFEFHRAAESIEIGYDGCRKIAPEIAEIVAALS